MSSLEEPTEKPMKRTATKDDIHRRLSRLESRMKRLEELVRALFRQRPAGTDGIEEDGILWVGGKPFTGFSDKERRMLTRLSCRKWVPALKLAQYVYQDPNLRKTKPVEAVKNHLNRKLAQMDCPITITQRTRSNLQYRLDVLSKQ